MRALLIAVTVLSLSRLMAQSSDPPPAEAPASENWNLYYQATSIGQNHGTFNSPYTGPLSLQDYREDDVSLTTTLFFDVRLAHNLQFVFDPEIAGGRGFSGVDGLANPSNGELPRVATATPKPYIARLYLTYDFGFGSEKEHVESDDNQLAGDRPHGALHHHRRPLLAHRFLRQQRLHARSALAVHGLGVMYNGAWDYPADTRGYTWGWVHEFHTRNWSLRYASAAEPTVANGGRFDRRLFVDLGTVFEQRAALLAWASTREPSGCLNISITRIRAATRLPSSWARKPERRPMSMPSKSRER